MRRADKRSTYHGLHGAFLSGNRRVALLVINGPIIILMRARVEEEFVLGYGQVICRASN